MIQQKSVIGGQTQKCSQITTLSTYLVWTGWGGAATVLIEVLSSNTGLSIE